MSSTFSKGRTRENTKEPSQEISASSLKKLKLRRPSSPHEKTDAHEVPLHDEDYTDDGVEERATLPIIRARKRKVANATVLNKWVKLPDAAKQEISTVLRDLERPVLAAMRSDSRRTEAQKVLYAARAS